MYLKAVVTLKFAVCVAVLIEDYAVQSIFSYLFTDLKLCGNGMPKFVLWIYNTVAFSVHCLEAQFCPLHFAFSEVCRQWF